MKKLMIFFAAFAILAAGCPNQLTEHQGAAKTGVGAVQVTIGETNARTLLPSYINLYYTLHFTADDKDAVTDSTLDLTSGGSAETTIALEEGTWTLAVKGYLSSADAADESKAVASGEKSNIAVTESKTTSITVPLIGKIESGTGTLAYNITYPAGVTSVTLTYGKIGEEITSINITDASSSMIPLAAGYYQMGVYLTGEDREAGKVEAAHIADRLTTTMDYTFAKDDFVNDQSLAGSWVCLSGMVPGASFDIAPDLSVSIISNVYYMAVAMGEDVPNPVQFSIKGRLVKNTPLWESGKYDSYYSTKENEYILADVALAGNDEDYPGNSFVNQQLASIEINPPVMKFEFSADGSFVLSAVHAVEPIGVGELCVTHALAGTYINQNIASTTYRIIFNSNGGTNIPAVTGIDAGSKIALPAIPTKSGFTFEGWFTDNGKFQNTLTSPIVTNSIILYAKWKKGQMPVPAVSPNEPAIGLGGTGNPGRHDNIVNTIANNQKIIFIGDSITQRWENAGIDAWAALKAKYDNKITNLGFDGDPTENVIWRLLNGEFPIGVNPEYVVLLIGTNNTRERDGAAPTAAGIGKIIEIINNNSPNTKILLFGILPRGDLNDPHDLDSGNNRRKTSNIEVNSIIERYAGFKNTQYYDIGEYYIDEDEVIRQDLYIPDDVRWYVHLSPAGYDIWKDKIVEIIGD
jgi:uncharacterized repeat protein (TIGR02543 family)